MSLKLRSAALRHVFRMPSELEEVCARSWAIAPHETTTERPAVFLAGELDRVLAVQEETTLEAELARVRGGIRHHAATRAFELRDVTVFGGRVFKGAMNRQLSQLAQDDAGTPPVHMPSAAVGSTLVGSIYFGHWLHDDLALQLATQAMAPTISIARQSYRHEAGYREVLAMADPLRVADGRFDRLFLLQDWGQNAGKRQRYADLRQRLRNRIDGRGNDCVYIRRGRSRAGSGRDLVNADALEAHLAARGFAIVDPDTMSAAQIAAATLDAKLVLGLEGSHLAHAVYPIAAGGTLVTIQPPQRFNNVFKDIADAMDLHYAFIVAQPAEGGFEIELDRLDRLLEKAAAIRG